jgi:hypothetical protein
LSRRLLGFELLEERLALSGTVIDHNDLAVIQALPQSAFTTVNQQRWFFAHASVGANMVNGIADLHTLDATRYGLTTSSVGYNSAELRANSPSTTVQGKIYECNRGNPGWQSKLTIFQNSVNVSGWHDSNVDVVMDKFCYIDQTASATSYLDSMSTLEAAYPNTRFVYMTMPLMTSTDSNNILRNTYNNTVRAYCVANGKLLFDLADIECYDPGGNATTFVNGSTTYQRLYSGYSTDGGHLNDASNVGRQRAALGWYATAAYIAGTLSTPTDLALSSAVISENQAAGTTVGTLATTDRDPGTFTYSLVDGDGSTDNGLFQIAGNQLQIKQALDFETQPACHVRVRTTDSLGLSCERTFTITVTNTNDAPTVVNPLSDVTVAEDAASTVIDLSTVFADPDAGDTLAYVVAPTTVAGLAASVSQPNYTHLLQDLLYTHTGDNRGIGGAQHDLARNNIEAYFASLGLTTSLEPFIYSGATYYNVVATKLGATRPNDVYLVGAHYDSVNNPGADDNASGTAGVMEIARVLASCQFDATLRFVAFDREEQGLKGSYAYISAHTGENVLGMISLDMIAYNPAGTNQNKVALYDRYAGGSIKSNLASAVTTYATGLTAVDRGQAWGSDHSPFEEAGYDAAMMIEYDYGSNSNYHKATDAVETANYLDYTFATEITRAATGYLASAAGLLSTTSILTTQITGNTLTLDYLADQWGQLDVTVRATDRLGGWAEDTFHVTVSAPAGNLDADGNGCCDALTDGILILRYLFAPSGSWTYSDAIGTGATRTDREAIRSYLASEVANVLDCDGNGTADALTDGILILRYLFSPTGAWSYADAVGMGATRNDRDAIRAHLDQYNPARAAATLQVAMPSVALGQTAINAPAAPRVVETFTAIETVSTSETAAAPEAPRASANPDALPTELPIEDVDLSFAGWERDAGPSTISALDLAIEKNDWIAEFPPIPLAAPPKTKGTGAYTGQNEEVVCFALGTSDPTEDDAASPMLPRFSNICACPLYLGRGRP